MIQKKINIITDAWRMALQVRNFRLKISITFILLVFCAIVAPIIFQFIQQRKGILLQDYVLNLVPSFDLSSGIFLILYSLILSGIFFLVQNPNRFLLTLQAYVILTVFRFVTLLLTPLEAPVNISLLVDPLVQYFFYQDIITKDLFFSGHTSLLILLTLVMPNGILKKIFLAGSIAVAIMLLVQHAHYTIDIVFAPLFSWLALMASRLFFKES